MDDWITHDWNELIVKAKKDLSKLTPVQKRITRNGKSQMTTVYVKMDTVTKERPKKKKTPEPSKPKKAEIDIQSQLRPIRKKLGTETYKAYLKANGVTWEPNTDSPGADTMRASMAAKKWLEEGNELDKNLLEQFTNGVPAQIPTPPKKEVKVGGKIIFWDSKNVRTTGLVTADLGGGRFRVVKPNRVAEEVDPDNIVTTLNAKHEDMELFPDAKSILDMFEGAIRNQHFETGILVSQDGQELFVNQGTRNQVDFKEALQKGLVEGAILTHNHPSDSSFSTADINFLIAHRCHEIRAVGKENSYRLRLPVSDMRGIELDNFRDRYLDELPKIEASIRNYLQPKVDSREITPVEAGFLHNHLRCAALQKNLGFVYEAKGSGVDVWGQV